MFSTKNEEKKVKLRVEYSSENTGDKRYLLYLFVNDIWATEVGKFDLKPL